MNDQSDLEEITFEARESVTREADRLMSGVKYQEYGDPLVSLSKIAALWSMVLGRDITGGEVALCMVALKFARETNCHKRDNLVDLAAYAELVDLFDDHYG